MARVHSQRQRLLVIGCCALIALVCAIASVCHIGVLPPKLSSRHLDIAAAATRVTIDVPQPLVTNALAQDGDFQALDKRAALVGNLMSSEPVLARIAREARIEPSDVAAVTRITTGVQSAFTEPDSERRAAQIAAARKPYQLEVQPSQTLPLLSIYTQAPSVDEAVRLANAAVPATRRYLTKLARKEGLSPAKEVSLDQLGPAQGAIVNGGARVQIGGLTFLFVFASTLLLALGVARVRRGRRSVVAGYATPGGNLARSVRERRLAHASRTALQQAGDWPRTTRVLPWMVAVLIAVIFLIPFNDIQLNVSLPIDLKFDRLVLPFIIGTWALVLAAGGPNAPKLRLTWIHVALGAVVAVAFLSLVLDARGLNQTLEFDTSIKKLTLLASYVSLFVVVASVVRRTEVHAFMTFTLLLAIATALGMILEYRFEYNPFYSISDTLLPGIFQVGIIDPSGIDEIGRRAVQGPAQVPLEAVAMLAMALPIALVRLLQSGRTRDRVLYGLAAGHAARGDGLDLPQDGVPGADLGLHDARVLPPPRADQARAAGGRARARDPGHLARCAVGGRQPAQQQAPGRHHRQRPDRRLRRDPARRVVAPRVRPRLRQLRAHELPGPRHGAAAPAHRGGRHRPARLHHARRRRRSGRARADPRPKIR